MSDPVVVEHKFDHSPKLVWDAITQHDQMIKWFFDMIPAFEAKIGFETVFDIESGGRVFPHVWKMIEVVPLKKIVYDWRFGGYDGRSIVTWELSTSNNGTKLTLTHENPEPYDKSIPEFTTESCRGGWEYFIQGSLVNYLSKI